MRRQGPRAAPLRIISRLPLREFLRTHLARRGTPPPRPPTEGRRRKRLWLGLAAATLLIAAGVIFETYRRLHSEPNIHRGDKLPFIEPPPPPAPGEPAQPSTTGGVRRGDLAWQNWGFDLAHTRFNPRATQRPPFQNLWARAFPSWIEYTPAVDSRRVYVALNNGQVVAVSARTGKKIWRRTLPSMLATSPAISGSNLYVTALSGVVYALSRANGQILWQRKVDGPAESPPIARKGIIYFGTGSGSLYAVRAKDGSTLWKVRAGNRISGSPAYADGRVIVGS